MAQRSKGKTSSLWAPSGLLAALFLMAGGSKLGGAERHVQGFAHWGWPDWMRLIGGAVEVAASVLLLIPRVAFFGACALAVVMAGATYTHLFRATSEGGLDGRSPGSRRAGGLCPAFRRVPSRRHVNRRPQDLTAFLPPCWRPGVADRAVVSKISKPPARYSTES